MKFFPWWQTCLVRISPPPLDWHTHILHALDVAWLDESYAALLGIWPLVFMKHVTLASTR